MVTEPSIVKVRSLTPFGKLLRALSNSLVSVLPGFLPRGETDFMSNHAAGSVLILYRHIVTVIEIYAPEVGLVKLKRHCRPALY